MIDNNSKEFIYRHIGPTEADQKIMLKEVGYNSKNNKVLVRIDPGYFRPTDIDELRGDPRKAKRKLGWRPSTKFKDLVKLMVENDIEKIS